MLLHTTPHLWNAGLTNVQTFSKQFFLFFKKKASRPSFGVTNFTSQVPAQRVATHSKKLALNSPAP
jgi:hypothetical protein